MRRAHWKFLGNSCGPPRLRRCWRCPRAPLVAGGELVKDHAFVGSAKGVRAIGHRTYKTGLINGRPRGRRAYKARK